VRNRLAILALGDVELSLTGDLGQERRERRSRPRIALRDRVTRRLDPFHGFSCFFDAGDGLAQRVVRTGLAVYGRGDRDRNRQKQHEAEDGAHDTEQASLTRLES
jgi:hypothetical protein